jgi:hypothetical protein
VAGGDLEGTVKGLLKIVLGGFLAFMALAITQEWEFFSSAWFGQGESAPEASPEDREAAEATLRQMLTLMRHLYSSGGDPRFAERLPASDGLREEMLADIEYVARNHRRQDPALMRLEVVEVDPLGPQRLELRTREFWQVRFLSLVDGEPTDDPRWQIVAGRYLIVRTGRGWQVESWELDLDAEPEREAGDA